MTSPGPPPPACSCFVGPGTGALQAPSAASVITDTTRRLGIRPPRLILGRIMAGVVAACDAVRLGVTQPDAVGQVHDSLFRFTVPYSPATGSLTVAQMVNGEPER